MPQTITVLTVADLHRSEDLYDLLTIAVKARRPDIVALLGADLWPFVEEWRLSGRELHLLETRTFTYGPLVIVGFPSLAGFSDALTGAFPADPDRWLPHLIRPFGPAGRALGLMHEPPHGTPLIRADGTVGGNLGWMECVERFSPWLLIPGHDHVTPQRCKQWHRRLPCGTRSRPTRATSEEGPLWNDELETLLEIFGTQTELTLDEINKLSKVDVDQFYGIEIGEWPGRMAEVALWLMDHQMDLKVFEAFGQLLPAVASQEISYNQV